MSSQQRILVTGASGFVASYVVSTLLEKGYAVRGTVRSAKLAEMKAAPISTKNPSTFEVITIDDLATADFTEALKGVSAIIHIALPFPAGTPDEILKSAKHGATNILQQALEKGITKVVITGSWGATMNPEDIMTKPFAGYTSTEKDFGIAPEEDFHKNEGNIGWNYLASKILSERVSWEFARDNRSLDLAAILPTFIFGPFHPDFLTPGPDRLGSNDHIYNLIKGEAGRPLGFQLAPQFVDVRDVAVAHVKALSVPPAESKRYLISSGFLLKKQAVEYLAKTYPELTDRLPTLEGAANIDEKSVTVIDTGKAERELGLKEYIHWQKTLSDTVQSLLACEKAWEN